MREKKTERCAVTDQHKGGKMPTEILNVFKIPKRRHIFVYQVIKVYDETGSANDR